MNPARFISSEYGASSESASQREALIMEHLPQVRWIATRIHETLSPNVSLEDVISAGIVGLITAIDHYDPAFNVKLRTYAEHKIRGAIYDSLRALDWAPHTRRRQAREVQNAIQSAEQKLQRSPQDEEIARELGLPVAEYLDLLAELQVMQIGSLDEVVEKRGERHLLHFRDESQQGVPARQFERAELERILMQGVERMPKLERTVLSLYFVEDLSLREIGEVVGLQTSRVSQLKSQALLRLRAYLDRYWPTGRGI
jgi:RNA polymerase sigma factor FliA